MFEGLLESILNKVLGQYIQGLNKKDLSISVWSGDVQLSNVKLRADIFKQFKLPLELICGQIGFLKISVPWKSLGSKPVDVLIENVQITVRPITDQAQWQLSDQKVTFESKEQVLNAFASQLYLDLIKTKEELAKEAGMMKGLITKIIDNLQINLQNVHVRIENEDLEDKQSTFSLGVTLKSMSFNTTDQLWKKQFVDRTLKENAQTPLYKLLSIDNFAVYYKIQETSFIQHVSESQQISAMKDLFKTNPNTGKIEIYEHAYLLDPMKLEVKMQQYDAALALAKLESLITLNIQLEKLGICLQKAQYDNLQRLLELTSDFMRFLNTSALRQKKVNLREMYQVLKQESKSDAQPSKRDVKELFKKLYSGQLDLVIKIGLDEKKAVELQKSLLLELTRQQSVESYQKIVLAIEQSDLQTWAKEVATVKSEKFKEEKEKKAQNKSTGWFGFGGSNAPAKPAPSNGLDTLVNQSLVQQIEADIEKQLELEEQMTSQFALQMKAVPSMRINFSLSEFKVTLESQVGNGVQVYSKQFVVSVSLFETSNKHNPHSVEIQLQNKAFGVDVLQNNVRIPFVQQLESEGIQQALVLGLALGNMTHKQSDLPKDQIDTTDLMLDLSIKPIEIIFQAQPVEGLTKFFKVKNMRDHTKIAAQEQFAGLSKQVNTISKSFEADLKNNKVSIRIDAPCLILPFKQSSMQEIQNSECWVFTMGDAVFKTTSDPNVTDTRYHEAFKLKVQRVKFEYASKYRLWKEKQAVTQPVLQDFQTTVLILRRRDKSEMANQEARDALSKIVSPEIEIRASFDTDVQLQLKPEIFGKLCRIGDLLVTEAKQDEYYINKMNKKLSRAILTSQMKKQNFLKHWVAGTGCIVQPGKFYFFEENNVQAEFEFSLDGIGGSQGLLIEGQEITLLNSQQQRVQLMLPTMKSSTRWVCELLGEAKKLELIKKNVDLLETSSESMFDFIEEHVDENAVRDTVTAEKDPEELELINFQFKFEAPCIQLHLITESIRRSVHLQSNSLAPDQWRLNTYMEKLSINFQSSALDSKLDIGIRSLNVSDNSGDERFPVIFENQPSDGQEELVSIKMRLIQKLSPLYNGVDTELSITFGGLIVYWKPQCIIYLVQFLSSQHEKQSQRKDNLKSSMAKSELDLSYEGVERLSTSVVGMSQSIQGEVKKQKSCLDKPDVLLKVNLNLSFMRSVFIHPQNHTYPIFTLELQKLGMSYEKKCDCDNIEIKIKNLQVHDNTNYPNTLNPKKIYLKSEPILQNEIMGVNVLKDQESLEMLNLHIFLFTYPGETGCCPNQPSKDFNLVLFMTLSQIKILFMMEQTMRMLDFVNHQVAKLISNNADIEDDMISRHSLKLASASFINRELEKGKRANHAIWENFDLMQTKQGPCLDIQICSPLIIIPDLKKDLYTFQLDLGTVDVQSLIKSVDNRWVHFQNRKTMLETNYLIQNKRLRFDLKTDNKIQDTIFNEDSLNINVALVNPSPYLEEDSKVATGVPGAPIFDLGQVDTSLKVDISMKHFRIKLEQKTLIYLFEVLNNNIMLNDKYTVEFENALRTQADSEEQKPEVMRVTGQDRQTMTLTVKAGCLAVEMRHSDNELVCEICIVGFDYNQSAFLSGRSTMSVNAGTMFMFHDEVIVSNLKQVMMGHLNAKAEVQTNDNFYVEMPEEFQRNVEMAEEEINFKLMIENHANGDSDMFVELLSIKLYLRQKVFLKMSEFFISALERLDSLKPQQQDQEQKPSTASSKIQVHIKDTLLILDNTDVSRKCIAVQTSLDLIMKSTDPKNLRLYLEPNKEQVYSHMKIDVKQVSAVFCDIDDIADNGYTVADKRDILQPLECCLDWDIYLKNDFPVRMVTNSKMTVNLSEASLKLSSDDLFILTAISEKQTSDLAALGKVWSDFSSKKQPAASELQNQKLLQQVEKLDQELNSIFFNGSRAEVLIINESEGCYVPLFIGICDKISFTQQSDSLGDTSGMFVQTDVAVDYFNANLGYYEPVIEKFALMYKNSQRGKTSDTKVELLEPLSINFTVDLAGSIASFQKLWISSQDRAAQFKKRQDALKVGVETFFTKKATKFTKKTSTKFQTQLSKQQEDLDNFKGVRKETLISHATRQVLSEKDQIKKLASPYAIRNLTDKPIKIFTIDKKGNILYADPEVVDPDQMIKLVFNLQGSNEKKNLTRKVGVSQGSQMDQYVRLVFSEPNMLPVTRLNLNHNNSMIYHNVYNQDGLQVQTLRREKYVLLSKLEDNRRVLTVRTQYVMRNQTKVEYNIRVFYLDTETNRVKVLKDARLKPGESTPLPDCADVGVQTKIKIAVRPSRCKKWSQEFKLHAMKTKIESDVNVVWQHDQTYSILRKEATQLKDVYDLVLQSPMIVKNCLPCPLQIELTEKQIVQDSKMPQPMAASNKQPIIDEDAIFVRSVKLDREEEKFLQDIKKQTGELTLSISLGKQFYQTEIQLAPDQAKEGDTQIRIVDKQNRSFSIIARVDTKKAGLKIVFFCENLMICNTMQRLSFFYQRKPGVFQQDNSNEFPSPIIDDSDRVVYIFEDTKNVVAMLANNVESVFSDRLFIGTTSTVGDFSVTSRENKKQFNFAYQVQLWSASETEFISTRIVDVAPQFILCNKTIYQLMFTQEQAGHTFLRLDPGERQPYHWEDRQRPALIKFKPVIDSFYFTPSFPLKDCGSVIICSTSSDDNKFFKVTKRIINQSIFCVIEDSLAPYVIRNNLPNITLRIQQTDQQINQRVGSRQEVCFSWSNVQVSDPMLSVEFKLGEQSLTLPQRKKTRRIQKQAQTPQTVSKFSLDTLNQVSEVAVMNGNERINIFVSTYKDTNNKVIEFGDAPSKLVTDQQIVDQIEQESQLVEEEFELVDVKPKRRGPNFENKDKSTMLLQIAQISLSCVNDGHEVLNMYLHDIQVMQTTTDTDSVMEAKLGRFQIDNNYDTEPLYPVMMKPKCLAAETVHDHLTMLNVDPVIQVYIHTKMNVPNVNYYAMIEFLVKELELKMELEHILKIVEWTFAVQEQLNTTLTSVNPVFVKQILHSDVEEESKEPEQKPARMVSWREEEVVQKSETTIYIQNYKGSPLCLELSLFKQTAGTQPQKSSQKNLGAKVFEKLGNFGIQLTSINNAPIKLEALEIQNIFGNQADIQAQLLAHYTGNIRQNILRVAASSDLLGNPYTFVNTLGTGVKKFYYEPRDGFMEGPLQGGYGILKGTAGVLNYTAASMAGSIGKMTNTMNKGLIMLSGDKEYIHEKEISDIKNKPKTTLSGMWQGTKSLGQSVVSGVSGVVTKPVAGAQSGGIGGFFKGAGIGLAGLVTKPVSGVVDLVSKTSQGIETQVTGSPECDQNMKRMRQPRPFYRDLKIIREFNSLHAEVYNKTFIKLNLDGSFFGAFKCGLGVTDTKAAVINQDDEILVLTTESLFSLDKDFQVRWSCKNYEIVQIEAIEKKNSQSKLRFTYSSTAQNRTLFKEALFANQDQLKECLDQLEEIKHIIKQLL